jgi:FKBP-type peptidyl-prolyl cis-trans isomerase (trigger factor)|tara:strand:- start:77 stop:268 length:192 start_codon:yes stop_codon:yes gene_type:complete
MKLKFDSGKNTQLVTFKVDPTTNSNLTALRNMYSKEAKRRVTTGEIVKKLINLHHEEILGEKK